GCEHCANTRQQEPCRAFLELNREEKSRAHMGAEGGISQYEGIGGGTLGGLGDIVQAATHKNLKFPKATGQENRLRRMSLRDLENARNELYSGSGLYDQTLPEMYNAIPGMHATVDYDPQAQDAFNTAYSDVTNRVTDIGHRQDLKAALRGAKGGAAKKTARTSLKDFKKTLKGQPTLDELNQRLYGAESRGPKLRITQNAPTQTDQNAQSIQDALSNRTLAALHGELANPSLELHLGNEQRQMEEAMRRSMGGDWASSSGGIEAQQRFNEYANGQRDASNRQDIASLYPEQMQGQAGQYGFAGMRQGLMSAPSMTLEQMAGATAGMVPYETGAQQPYQFDRSGR